MTGTRTETEYIRKLEIGPGPYRLGPEWETVDAIGEYSTLGYGVVWGEQTLPFEDETFALVYASHVLEHVPWYQTIDALREAYRVLLPGGVMEVWVPDFRYLVECYREGKCGDDWRKHNPDNNPMTWLNGRIYTYGGPLGLGDPNWHRAVFDEEYLKECMGKVGFALFEKLSTPRGHDHGLINLGISGVRVR